MAPTIANMVMTMVINQLSENKTIDAATRRNEKVFVAYIVVLLVTAILIAAFTWLTWDSGNKLQDAIRQDANARIQEASQGVTKLRQDNLNLEHDLEAEKGKVAGLQKDAANAKTAQQRVEIELAKQQERAAKAETSLLELKKHNEPRNLTDEQKQEIASKLRQFSGQKVNLFAYSGDNEIVGIANEIIALLRSPNGAGWSVSVSQGTELGRSVGNILVEVNPEADATAIRAATALVSALKAEGLSVNGPTARQGFGSTSTGNSDPNAQITITIGRKM